MDFEKTFPLTDRLAVHILKEFEGSYQLYKEDTLWHRRNVVFWNDLVLAETLNTELRDYGRKMVSYVLGYVPCPAILLPYESMLRAIAVEHKAGRLSEKLFDETESLARLMRNDEAAEFSNLTYTPEEYRAYNEGWLPFGQQVRERLVRLLNYEPPLEHSLEIEMCLRRVMADDTQPPFLEDICDTDLQYLNILFYREVLLTEGKVAADASPVEAAYYREMSAEDNRIWRGK